MFDAGQPSDSADLCKRPRHSDFGQRHGAIALRQPRPVFVEHQRDMSVDRLGVAQQPREVGLPWRRRQQVVSAHHLVDALGCVVDDHREVVGRDAVAAADHEVVDDAGVAPVQHVGDGVRDGLGAQPQRRRPAALAAASLALGVGQVAADARVGTLRRVRRLRCLGDIPSAAITLVQQAALSQLGDHRVVAFGML